MSRAAALRALKQIDKGLTCQEALENTGLSGDERRFCSDLVYGVLRTRLHLEQELSRFLPRINKLPPELLSLLHLGAYGLLFQDNAQNYAVVNETVKLAKARFGQRLANVANAVLRRLAARARELTARGDDGSDENDELHWSVPPAIAELWRHAYGDEVALTLMRRSFQRPWPCLRVNLSQEQSGLILRALSQCPGGERVGVSGVAFPPGKLPREVGERSLEYWLQAGMVSHQAAGSQEIIAQLGLLPRWRNLPIWDACAGVGGKAAILAESGLDVALASDLSPKRLYQMRLDFGRLHLPLPPEIAADVARPPLAAWSGNILIDAPCSGLGVLGRRPDIKYKFASRDMPRLLASQQKILQSLAGLLRPGRELAYITCTLNPAENEAQIATLHNALPQLEIVKEWQTPPDHPWLEGMYGCLLLRK